MPDSGKPISPNFVPGVGRLVTDRYDFEDHILGTNFRHNADAIDVRPNLVVGSTTCVNVLQALEALAAAAEPPVIAPATQTMLGAIQLTRDLGGTNGLSPKVVGLQGFPVSPQTPITNNVLTWTGSAWVPQSIVGLFIPGADLGGSSPTSSASLQYVSNLSGNAGTVGVSANFLLWSASATPFIGQSPVTSGSPGATFGVVGQTNLGTGPGGNLVLGGGAGNGGGLPGSTLMNVQGNTVFQVGSVLPGQVVAAFFTPSGLNSTQMPANAGNGVIYIANATNIPTTGTPTGGAVLYGTNGQLWIKQSDSTTFQIGSIPDPSTWSAVTPASLPPSPTIPANGTLTYNVTTAASAGVGTAAITFAMPTSSSCRFDTVYIAKEVGTGNTAQYNYSIGFVRNGAGAPTAVGSVTSSDPRSIGSWNVPPTSTGAYVSGNNIIIATGSSTATNTQWTVITQVIVTTA